MSEARVTGAEAAGPVVVDPAFNGPAESGNGGYSAGLFAGAMGPASPR